MSIAYALRADFEGTYLGGIVRAGDRTIDVGAELEAHGRLVVDETDTAAVLVLDAYPALKRVPAGDDDEPTVDRYAARTVPELRDELRRRDLSSSGNRDELVARLEAADHGTPQPAADDPVSGDLGRAGNPDTPTTTPEA